MKLRTFVSVLVGPSPDKARPVFASGDPAIVEALLKAIIARVGWALTPEELVEDEQDHP